MADSFVGSSIEIEGEISTDEPLVVEGTLRGRLNSRAGVVVAGGGVVDADVRAESISVEGEANGSLWAEERIELRRDCKVTCQLTAPCVVIDEGSSFSGSVETHAGAA